MLLCIMWFVFLFAIFLGEPFAEKLPQEFSSKENCKAFAQKTFRDTGLIISNSNLETSFVLDVFCIKDENQRVL